MSEQTKERIFNLGKWEKPWQLTYSELEVRRKYFFLFSVLFDTTKEVLNPGYSDGDREGKKKKERKNEKRKKCSGGDGQSNSRSVTDKSPVLLPQIKTYSLLKKNTTLKSF